MEQSIKNSNQIGIQGGAGSFHEQALLNMYGDKAEPIYESTFNKLFKDLRSGRLGSALIAIANNRFGNIAVPFNELMSGDFYIIGETYLPVKHQLLGVPGAKIDQIQEVHSMEPALGQCGAFLSTKNFVRVEQEDTAISAELIAKWQDPTKGAIASTRAGEINGLSVLAKNIQDDPDNITRFLHIEKRNGQLPNSKSDKTTAILQTTQAPGSLADALLPFKNNGVNIESLHSSYIPNSAFTMQFFIEFDAGSTDPRTSSVINSLLKQGCEINLIGSYSKKEIEIGQSR